MLRIIHFIWKLSEEILARNTKWNFINWKIFIIQVTSKNTCRKLWISSKSYSKFKKISFKIVKDSNKYSITKFSSKYQDYTSRIIIKKMKDFWMLQIENFQNLKSFYIQQRQEKDLNMCTIDKLKTEYLTIAQLSNK